MNIDRLTDLDRIAEHREAWMRLRRRHGQRVPNNDFELYAATVQAMPEVTPDVTLIRDGNGLRAIVIGHHSMRRPHIRCLDIVYGGLITDGTPEAVVGVTSVIQELLEGAIVDHVMINHLPLQHELAAPLTPLSRAGDRKPHRRFELAEGTVDRTFERFSRKHRYNLRRADRMLGEACCGELRLDLITRAEQIGPFLEDCRRVGAASWQGPGLLGRPAVQEALLGSAAADGRLRCYRLAKGDVPLAYQVGVVCDGVYFLNATAYDARWSERSPGHVLLARVIRDLGEAGIRTIDYGFGDAQYKRQYGTSHWSETSLFFYATTPWGQRARITDSVGGVARRLAVGTGLAAGIRRIQRHRVR